MIEDKAVRKALEEEGEEGHFLLVLIARKEKEEEGRPRGKE